MAGAGRSIAGVAIAVAAALVLFLALRGHAARPPGAPAAGGPAPATVRGDGPASAAGSSPVSSAAAVDAPAGTGPHADPLSGAAAAYVAGRSGTVLAAVYDITTGQSWRLGDGPAQDEASVVKLDILETLLARQDGGTLPQADQALAESMIEDSDNDAATSLWDEAGGAQGIGAYNDRAGLARTTPSPCVACAGFPWPGWGLTTTVPYDQLSLLKQLVVPGAHPLLSAAERSYALSLMENVTPGQAWRGHRRGDGSAQERMAPAQRREHELAGQQRRLGLRRRQGLPGRRAQHREPDRAVRHRHDQRPVAFHLDGDALTRPQPRITAGPAGTA
jgi:hypothetical protein